MAPKSSDGEVKDGSSSDTELMNTPVGIALSLLGKRRAETRISDDSGESDVGAEGEGEEYEGDEDGVEFEGEEDGGRSKEEPTWGYDSFDDLTYDYSDKDEEENKEEECAEKLFEREWRYYRRQLIETKGFFEPSDRFPPNRFSGLASLGLDERSQDGLTVREFCATLTSLCLEKYNEDEGLNVKLDHILRVNFDPGSMTKFYITFAARESECTDAPLVEYQAKAAWSVANKTYPILCRPSPPTKTLC